jgi:putative tryptophan/tyrosine transport system substrate-binding protein
MANGTTPSLPTIAQIAQMIPDSPLGYAFVRSESEQNCSHLRSIMTEVIGNSELGAKQLGLLHDLMPGAVRIGLLVDPTSPITEPFVPSVLAAAPTIGKHIEVLSASTGSDIHAVFASLTQKSVDAILIAPSALSNGRRVQLATLAAYHRVPAIHYLREFAEAGGLMSYGTSITDAHRQFGVYVGRILKGEKPGALPVMQSSKFEFVINLNTAKAFGFNFPPGLLAIADEVIE